MSEPNIQLSEVARAFAEAKAREEGLDGPDRYVEALVERAIRQDERRKRLEALLLKGLDSGPARPVDEPFWEELRQRVRDRIPAREGS